MCLVGTYDNSSVQIHQPAFCAYRNAESNNPFFFPPNNPSDCETFSISPDWNNWLFKKEEKAFSKVVQSTVGQAV